MIDRYMIDDIRYTWYMIWCQGFKVGSIVLEIANMFYLVKKQLGWFVFTQVETLDAVECMCHVPTLG